MWRRLRRRTMGPSRPVFSGDRWMLLLVTLLALLGSIAFVVSVVADG